MNKLVSLLPVLLVVGLVGYMLGGTSPAQSFTATNTPAGWQIDPLPYGQTNWVSHPRNWVQIYEGVNYTVPTGKIMVLAAMGSVVDGGGNPILVASYDDGATWQQRVKVSPHLSTGDGVSVKPVPTGLAFPEGVIVRVDNGDGHSCYWGYLVNS